MTSNRRERAEGKLPPIEGGTIRVRIVVIGAVTRLAA